MDLAITITLGMNNVTKSRKGKTFGGLNGKGPLEIQLVEDESHPNVVVHVRIYAVVKGKDMSRSGDGKRKHGIGVLGVHGLKPNLVEC